MHSLTNEQVAKKFNFFLIVLNSLHSPIATFSRFHFLFEEKSKNHKNVFFRNSMKIFFQFFYPKLSIYIQFANKYCRYLNYIQNEPIMSKQELKIVKISHIIDLGFLVIAYMANQSCTYIKLSLYSKWSKYLKSSLNFTLNMLSLW